MARELELRDRLLTLRLTNQSMESYLRDIKSIADQLAAIGKSIPVSELVIYTLRGLPRSYDMLVTTLSYATADASFDQVRANLLNFEQRLKHIANDPSDISTTALYSSAPSFRSKGRASYRSSFRRSQSPGLLPTPNQSPLTLPRSDRRTFGNSHSSTTTTELPRAVICQICGKRGHVAVTCLHRYNRTLADVPEALAALTIADSASNLWYTDSGATHHMTHAPGMLSSLRPYDGSTKVFVGNGQSLPISGVGQVRLSTPVSSLSLVDVLYVPDLKHNLLSIKKLCLDNDCIVEFDTSSFLIKDRRTGSTLLHQQTNHPLYPVRLAPPLSPTALITTSAPIWHARLGHPHPEVLRHLQRAKLLSVSSSSDMSRPCPACA
ncbi:hypothetical protein MLD38_007032 [Melastoma candidum]|uniref:Uncharacterized protein n=1 Tax=Melastoma candidum TaxID=119954 RepID=A0ACB9RPS6_9MYRT|nr:hypothetical protein MLD38_007032 [Melastoma candidum]